MKRKVCSTKLAQPLGTLALAAALGVLSFFIPLTTARAQVLEAPGTVSGRVTDERDQPIAGAQIELVEINRGTLSQPSGEFIIDNVPRGTYTLRVTIIGFRSQTVTIEVRPGETSSGHFFSLAVDYLNLEGIVVTATRSPRVKLESSTAITTISKKEIEQDEPASTADLMKSVPGFYVEASGGEVNNNLFVRGLPADGSYKYVIFMEDGMPANDGNDFFFLGADNFIRVDENIDRLEAVRGGNSALFGANAPGGVVNLISKTGGPSFAGSLKAAYGTDDFNRYDLNVNGPLAENWRFSVGGYYRFDEGIRDPGFPAARGGQLKANVTRLFDRGYVRVSGKYINDKNIFHLPLPLVPAEDVGEGVVKLNSEFAPGFPSDGTLSTIDANGLRVPLPQGNGELTMPLENGIAQVGGTIMADFGITFPNDWSIQNTLRVMNLEHQWNALTSDFIIRADRFVEDVQEGLGTLEDAPADAITEFTFAATGEPFDNPNNLLSAGNLIHVEKPVTNFSNQFLVNKTVEAGETRHDLTLGAYFGHYTADNRWFINSTLTEVRDRPRLVNARVTDPATGEVFLQSQNGFAVYVGLPVIGFGNATLFSFFGGDEIQLTDRLRIDLGGRFEHDSYVQNVENTTGFDLEDPTTTADDEVNWGDGTFKRFNVGFDEWAASVGVNYGITEQISLYGRGSRGYRMPLLDQFLFAPEDENDPAFPDEAETLWQVEGGVKISSPMLGLSAVGYWLQLQDFPSQDLQRDPETGETRFVTAFVGKARTIGAEAEAVVAPVEGLRLNGLGTLQFHEYIDFISGEEDFSDNWVRRIPRVIGKLGGSYNNSGFTIGGDWNFIGKRFSNNANTIELPEFGYVNGRVSYDIPGQGVTLSAAALNLLDGEGLTEGNPRLDEAGAPSGPALARPILPRRWVFAVRYDF